MPERVSAMQPTLFDADRLKTKGQDQALGSERAWPWKDHAMGALYDLASTGKTFTADDLVARVGLPDANAVGMNKNNAVGAIFSAAAKAGWIVPTGNYRKSVRRSNHSAVLAIWTGNPEHDF